jgi:hypothetical protein
MHRLSTRLTAIAGALAIAAFVLAGCGSSETTSKAAPSAAEFPSTKGKTIAEVLHYPGAKQSNLVIAPAAASFVKGPNRYPFGVFTLEQEQVEDADVAMYFAKNGKSKVLGPYPAHLESLETKPAYRAATSGAEGDAKSVYVVPKVDFNANGEWLAVAMLKGKDGLEATRPTGPTIVGTSPQIPAVGERPPAITTLTAADVGGQLEKIDTRVPPDQMHKVDFAKVLGKKPIVLVFATPALCQSRVCGPVVDVAQQVADEYEPKADFIHQEVYVNNEPPDIRPQLKAFHLESEPWTFLIDKHGKVRDVLQGAYGVAELEEAMKTIVPS